MPTAEYKQCLVCGKRFHRAPRRSQAQWDSQRFDTASCARTWNGTRHGATKGKRRSREYQSWLCMKSRCLNPHASHYEDYGGRGITVCARWRSDFVAFLDDMGERPPDTSLDRIDNNGNYEPGNCRWATPKEQATNRCRCGHYGPRGASHPMSPMTYCFAVKRVVPVWREDPTLPEGGYLDRFHTVHVSEAEYRRLQDDGLIAMGDRPSLSIDSRVLSTKDY